MNRLQLATLLSWAGDEGMQGRKRLQKVAYCLQQAGCPLDCDYTLHHFGPYSRDVADICDEMVAAGLVEERGGPKSGVMQYEYRLQERTKELLQSASPDQQMQGFEPLAKSLIADDLWSLELGSTVLLFHEQNSDWNEAFKKACDFKKVNVGTESSKKALALAKKIKEVSAV